MVYLCKYKNHFMHLGFYNLRLGYLTIEMPNISEIKFISAVDCSIKKAPDDYTRGFFCEKISLFDLNVERHLHHNLHFIFRSFDDLKYLVVVSKFILKDVLRDLVILLLKLIQ